MTHSASRAPIEVELAGDEPRVGPADAVGEGAVDTGDLLDELGQRELERLGLVLGRVADQGLGHAQQETKVGVWGFGLERCLRFA